MYIGYMRACSFGGHHLDTVRAESGHLHAGRLFNGAEQNEISHMYTHTLMISVQTLLNKYMFTYEAPPHSKGFGKNSIPLLIVARN